MNKSYTQIVYIILYSLRCYTYRYLKNECFRGKQNKMIYYSMRLLLLLLKYLFIFVVLSFTIKRNLMMYFISY